MKSFLPVLHLFQPIDGVQGFVSSVNTPPVELPVGTAIPESGNDEQGVGPFPQSDVGRSNDLNHYLLSDEEVVSSEEPLSIQEADTCQLVNRQQQQPRYQQSAQASALNYPTQEMGLDGSQRRDRQELRHPIQETAPSTERTPDEHEDLPPCHPQLNGADINGVSSTGEREQAVEHNCSRQELHLWKQELGRQADVTHITFVWETKYIFKS